MQPITKSRRKALVVEERAADRNLGVAALRQLSYEAEAAASVGEALARLGQERFALVLLSSTLPDLAAPERAELRRLAEPISLPIVVMHAPDLTFERDMVELGAIGHISRPISSAAIKRLVEAAGSAASREASGEPIVDLDHLLSFTDGDLELESELSVLFVSSAEAYFDRMSRSLQAGTPWTSSVHALKGASANLGARRLAALARSAEHQPPAAADLEVIRRAIDEVIAFFADRHRTGGNASPRQRSPGAAREADRAHGPAARPPRPIRAGVWMKRSALPLVRACRGSPVAQPAAARRGRCRSRAVVGHDRSTVRGERQARSGRRGAPFSRRAAALQASGARQATCRVPTGPRLVSRRSR